MSNKTQFLPFKILTALNIILALIYGIGAYFVIPAFRELFISAGADLPAITLLVLDSYQYWIAIVILPIGLYLTYLTNDALSKAGETRLLTISIALFVFLILCLPLVIVALYAPLN